MGKGAIGGILRKGGGGGDMVPTMPGCVCPELRTWVSFWLQRSEMSENISLKMISYVTQYG